MDVRHTPAVFSPCAEKGQGRVARRLSIQTADIPYRSTCFHLSRTINQLIRIRDTPSRDPEKPCELVIRFVPHLFRSRSRSGISTKIEDPAESRL